MKYLNMIPGSVCGAGDSLHPLVTLPVAITRLNTELRPGPSKQRTTETVSENDFVSRVSYRAAEAADPRQSKDVYRAETVEAGRSLQLPREHAEHGAGVRGGHLLIGRTPGLLPGACEEYTPQSEARRPVGTEVGEVGEGFVGDEGQVLGQVYLGQRELRGRGLQPGQRVAGPPALRRPGGGVEAGPPASVYTSMGESEGSAAPQPAAPASTLSCTGPGLSSSWYMAARSSHLFSATLARTAAAL